jgi:hypothetical protein
MHFPHFALLLSFIIIFSPQVVYVILEPAVITSQFGKCFEWSEFAGERMFHQVALNHHHKISWFV